VTDTHTDRQTDGQTDTALRRGVKIDHIALHTKYNYQATSVIDSKFQADEEMSVLSTYLNDNAQTPLNGFVVYFAVNFGVRKLDSRGYRVALFA